MPRPLVPNRRRRILAEAQRLMLDKGWPATTVSEIAARAGIGKGAVYLEFPDKTAILAAALDDRMRQLTAQVHRQVVDAQDLVDLPTVYRFSIEALLADPLMCALYTGDQNVLGDHVRKAADDRYLQRLSWLGDYIERLQHIGILDAAIPADTIVHVLSVFTVGLIHAPGTLGATTPDKLSAAVGLFADLVGRGLATGLPADPEAAREAQLALLRRLETQLDPREPS
ncbi:TetR/AcrR family transcriptional regulator [Nocardia goodfellowii]|uniref:AcrR family transcriptional regulator n=1 Tax=Nocardia goodfellowii TaxID=882446 RepID=A0ABS4QI92_9NOCA|nr:TetR/AcrR family transcriptional regulator [Nocardia goodfellowii]MBP2191432.1 AcrR family transcriptional regulator [Nocardia goodfellowii]